MWIHGCNNVFKLFPSFLPTPAVKIITDFPSITKYFPIFQYFLKLFTFFLINYNIFSERFCLKINLG